MLIDGIKILPRDYKALKQYYEITLEQNEKLKADLRGKDNEIEVLKWRIKYLEQFKPKDNINQFKEEF